MMLLATDNHRYVAMHTIQDSEHDTHDDTNDGYANGHGFNAAKGEGQAPQLRETLLTVVGMLLPLLAQIGHAR